MTEREATVRWAHHVVAVSAHPFDPDYALQRTCERVGDGCTVSEVREVLRQHGSITFGKADGRLLALPSCLRPQCGEYVNAGQYCSVDCALADRAPHTSPFYNRDRRWAA